MENQCSRTTRTLCAVKEKSEGGDKRRRREKKGGKKNKENINTAGDRRCSRIEV